MQQRRLRHLDATPQRRFDMLKIVEPARADQVDDEMRAGKALAVALDEEVLSFIGRGASIRGLVGNGVNGKLENFRLGLA